MREIAQFLVHACRHTRDQSFCTLALVITLELALYSNVPQKLLMAFRMSILVPPRSICRGVSLSRSTMVVSTSYSRRRCHHKTLPVVTRDAGSYLHFTLGWQAVSHCLGWEAHSLLTLGWQHRRILWKDGRESLEQRPCKLFASSVSLSIRPVGTMLVRRRNPRIMAKSMAKCLSIPVGARGFVTESNTRLQSTIRMAEETLDVCVSVCRTKKQETAQQ